MAHTYCSCFSYISISHVHEILLATDCFYTGNVRRMSKFDRLPESDSDEEEDEIDPEEEARQRAALKRAQPWPRSCSKGCHQQLQTDPLPMMRQCRLLEVRYIVLRSPSCVRIAMLVCVTQLCAPIDCHSLSRATQTCIAFVKCPPPPISRCCLSFNTILIEFATISSWTF